MILIYKKSHKSQSLVIIKRLKIESALRLMAKNVQVTEATLAWTRREQTYVIEAATMLLEGPRGHWAAWVRGRI